MKKWLLGIVAIATLFCAVEVKAQSFYPSKEVAAMYVQQDIENNILWSVNPEFPSPFECQRITQTLYRVQGVVITHLSGKRAVIRMHADATWDTDNLRFSIEYGKMEKISVTDE